MDTFVERLRTLTQNKYFAYLAVIFFSFVTALVFAIFAFQNTLERSNSDVVRDAIETQQTTGQTNTPGSTINSSTGDDLSQAQADPESPLDRIIRIFTGGGSSNNTSQTQDSSQTGTQGTTGNPLADRAEEIEEILRSSSPLPEISIEKYVLTTEMPQKPSQISSYELRNSYTDIEMEDVAQEFGFAQIDAIESAETTTQLYDLENGHFMSFSSDGSFTYLSETGIPVQNTSTDYLAMSSRILNQLNMSDTTIRPYATYQRTDDNGDYIYIEMHRDWNAMGAPILNPLGMLNLTEIDDISGLQIGSQQIDHHENEKIINTSDNTDGFARPDDFNTITIQYNPADGRMYGFSSNVPQILATNTATSNNIKSPIEAFNEYTRNQTTIGLTAPSGDGTVNLNDIYTDNLALAQSVNVADFELVYAMSPTNTPEYLCPSYVFRGFGTVQTGFESQFVHTVPALRDTRCNTAVLGTSTVMSNELAQDTTGRVPVTQIPDGDSSSLKYGTKTFVVRVVEDTPVNECPVNFNHSYLIGETRDTLDYLAWEDTNVRPSTGGKVKRGTRFFTPRSWYYLVKRKATSQVQTTTINPQFDRNEVLRKRAQIFSKCTIGDATDCPLDPKTASLETISCQFITTASPWIYAYGPTDVELNISLNPIGGVSYVQPAFSSVDDFSWNITTQSYGTIVTESGLEKSGLHWEYYSYPVTHAYRAYTANRATDSPAFVVAADQLPAFMAELYTRIGLTHAEKENALAELNRPSLKFDTPYIAVRFVDRAFLNTYVQLNVTPEPDTLERHYIELSGLSEFAPLQQPEIPTIERDGVTVVETGYIRAN